MDPDPGSNPLVYNINLRGPAPVLSSESSRLDVIVGTAAPSNYAGGATFTIVFSSNAVNPTNMTMLHVAESGPRQGTCLSATDQLFAQAGGVFEPFLSLGTVADKPSLRVDSNGVSILDSLTCPLFTNLIDSFASPSVYIPPTANALCEAYILLSNLYVTNRYTQAGAAPAGSNLYPYPLVDSYTDASVLNAPTANALRAAYANVSNLVALRLRDLNDAIPGVLAGLVASNPLYAANDSNGPLLFAGTLTLQNATYIDSVDGLPRLFLDCNAGTTMIAMPGGAFTGAGNYFTWFANDLEEGLMSLAEGGVLTVAGSVVTGSVVTSNLLVTSNLVAANLEASNLVVTGSLTTAQINYAVSNVIDSVTVHSSEVLTSNLSVEGAVTVGGSIGLGSNLWTQAGCNVGLNLAPGAAPSATLHVNGAVLSTETAFQLSDARSKRDVRGIEGALGKIRRLRGCTFEAGGGSCRRMGLLAQDVLPVVPEAVLQDGGGTLSVAYANLVALALEGIKELDRKLDLLLPPSPSC